MVSLANGSVKPFVHSNTDLKQVAAMNCWVKLTHLLSGFSLVPVLANLKSPLPTTPSLKKMLIKTVRFSAYNFSTSPLFTNSMLQNMENGDSGEAMKMTFNHSFPKVKLKVGYAELEFDSSTDREALILMSLMT